MHVKTTATALLLAGTIAIVGCSPVPDDAPGDAADATAAPAPAPAAAKEEGDFSTDTHSFELVAPGVYFVRYTVPMFNSNSMVLINDDDVLVVDSHITPATARELIASIRRVTDKPISLLVNTHFHYDHAHGNQAFMPAKIIGHEFTRRKMAGAPLEEGTFQRELAGQPAMLERLQARLAETEEAEERAGIEARLALTQAHMEATKEVDPVAPNITLDERLTLYRGEREIQIVFCGRAHTGGDVVVFLPNERIVFTGDMMLGGPSWLGDGFVDEWPQTLENLKALDFDVILPGHGPKFSDRALIDHVQDFYRELWGQVVALRADGKAAHEAAAAVDLTAFEDRLPGRSVGFDPLAVLRIYELLDERGA